MPKPASPDTADKNDRRSREALLEEIQALKSRLDALEHSDDRKELNPEGRERFRDFADVSSDWFWEMDESLRFSYFSDRFTEVTGIPQQALLGKTRAETEIPGVDEETWTRHLADLAAHRPFRDFRHSRTRPDGQVVHHAINGKPIFDEAGNFKGYRGTGRDITEQVQSEKGPYEANALFKKTEHLARLGHWEWDEIEDRCTYCSEEMARLHGVTVEEFREQASFSADDLESVHPEDRQLYLDVTRELRAKGKGYEIEYRLLQSGTGWIEVRQVAGVALDDEGKVVRSFGFVQDITKRKHAERELGRARDELEQRVAERTVELKESEARYREIFDESPVGIWTEDWSRIKQAIDRLAQENAMEPADLLEADPQLLVELYALGHKNVDVSKAALAMYGAHDLETLLARDKLDMLAAEELAAFKRALFSFMSGEWGLDYVGAHKRMDGSIVYLNTQLVVPPRHRKDWSRVIYSIEDITERKLTEAALREGETMLNSVIENVPLSLCLKDREGRFTLVNPGFERLHGVTNDQIKGKTFFDILPEEVAAAAAAEDRQVLDSGETLRTDYAWPPHLGNRHELIFKFPLRPEDKGPITGVGVIALDVTEQKWAEGELRESEARYREIFEESPLPLLEEDWQPVKALLDDLSARGVKDIVSYFHEHPDELGRAYDAAHRFGVSKATVKLYGAESEEVFRASLTKEAADPEELAGYGAMIAAFYGGATTYEYEAEETAFNGPEIVIRVRAVIPPNYRDCWSRVLITMEDITERRKAAQAVLMAKDQAEIANRAKSEFLANMSHELRTPLNAIIGFAEIIKDQRLGPMQNSRYREYVGDIHASGQHLLELITDILDLSKIEAGSTTLQDDVFDVAELLHICLRLVGERAKSNGLGLFMDIPETPLPGLMADPRLVKQILINLLSNAVKFTPSGGQVTVGLRASSDEGYLIRVSDTGIGMAPQDIPKALTRFQQIDGYLNRRFQGTGLGLPLSKSLAELHGGTLEIESALGEGTTVTIRFPAERLVARRHAPRFEAELTAVGA